ncbi:hypothetical protein JCM8202v2_003483 [Rhodotorula sphaerocarpa]
MTNLLQASTTRPRFVKDANPPPSTGDAPTDVYEADISPVWCVGSVAHGGVLVNVLVDAVLKRQARYSSAHRDPAHLSAQFLTATVPGKATVEVKVVSESKRWTRLDVELYQWTPDVNTTYYLDPKTQRTLRIRAHVLVTTLPDHPPLHAGSAVSAPVDMNNFLSRPCPLLVHPSQVDMSDGGTHVPEKLMFRDGMRWKDVEVTNSDGSLASGSWIELTGGEDVSLSAGNWYPTMSFALDFKSKFPLNPPPSAAASSTGPPLARRTFGIYSTTKTIHEGRHDLTVEVWAVDGELGVGPPRGEEKDEDGVARWRRDGARLVGVSTQMALSMGIAVNHGRIKKPAQPGESDADSSGSGSSDADSERRKARL